MKKKLLIQVGIITSVFLAVLLIAVETVVYISSQNVYLTAKNDMIERDLKVMYSDLHEVSAITGFFEYFQNNRDKMKAGISQEEYDSYYDNLSNDDYLWYSSDKTDEYLEKLDPIYLHIISDDYLYFIYTSMQRKSNQFGYDKFYILDIGQSSDGTAITYGGKDDEIANVASEDYEKAYTEGYEKVRSRLGDSPIFPASVTTAAEKLRSGTPGDVQYEVVNGNDGVPYYAGYILISSKDEHRYALCVLYDWSEFRQRLNNGIIPSLLISALLIVIANILLIRFLYVRSIRPVTQIQKNVREYTDTKDSERIINELSKITAQNEFGELATDVSYLANEIERYTAEIAQLAREKEREAAELELATSIQFSVLPTKFPAFPERNEFDLFASMDPAKQVGGDFYNFFLIDEDHLALAIADVSGKGVPAALFMMSAKLLMENYASVCSTPAEILTKVNDHICTQNPDNMFVTVWLGILEISTGKLICCNAGHEYPAIKKAKGSFALIKDKHGTVVGSISGFPYKNYELQLEKGDTIFVYTDGVPEATNAEKELFGTERMIDALNADETDRPEELLKTVRLFVDKFVGDAPQFDDLTMLALRYLGTE